MTAYGEKLVDQLMMSFFEDPSFKCARRIWLTCHHFDVEVPPEVLDVFLKQLESDDEVWQIPELKGVNQFKALRFIEEHMIKQRKEFGKASKGNAIDAYALFLTEEEKEKKGEKGKEYTAEAIERGIRRFKKKVDLEAESRKFLEIQASRFLVSPCDDLKDNDNVK